MQLDHETQIRPRKLYFACWGLIPFLAYGTLVSSHSPDMLVRFAGDSKLSVGVSVVVCLCVLAGDRCTAPSPEDRWHRLQHPNEPECRMMNGWMIRIDNCPVSVLYSLISRTSFRPDHGLLFK